MAAGVACIVLATIALAATSTGVATKSRSPAARALFVVSAASIAAGMIVAAIYGTEELAGVEWISIPRMVQIHGLVDALGFTLCGLLGHLALRARARNPGMRENIGRRRRGAAGRRRSTSTNQVESV